MASSDKQEEAWLDEPPASRATAADEEEERWLDAPPADRLTTSAPPASDGEEVPKTWWQKLGEGYEGALGLAGRALTHGHLSGQDIRRGVGYAGGLTSTAGLELAKRASTKGAEGLGTDVGIKEALKGHAASSDDILRKDFGLGEIGSRAIGIPYQIGTDPLTYLGVGLPRLAKMLGWTGEAEGPAAAGMSKATMPAVAGEAGKPGPLIGEMMGQPPQAAPDPEAAKEGLAGLVSATKPMTQATTPIGDYFGRGLYRKAFRKVDSALRKFKTAKNMGSETPFSDLAYDKQFLKAGMSLPEMEGATHDYREDVLGPAYNKILDDPKVEAQKSDLSSIMKDVLPQMQQDAKLSTNRPGALKAAAQVLKDRQLGRQYYPDGRSPRDLVTMAKGYSDTARGAIGLPGDVMKIGANLGSYKGRLMDIAQALRERAQELAEKALPGSKEEIQALNREYNILKEAEKPVNANMRVEANKAVPTQIDGGLLLTALHNPDAGLFALGKNLARYPFTPGGAVRIGNTLRKAGRTSLWDSALRESQFNKDRERE